MRETRFADGTSPSESDLYGAQGGLLGGHSRPLVFRQREAYIPTSDTQSSKPEH